MRNLESTKRGALILDPFKKSLYDLSYSHFSYLVILNVFGCLCLALQISRSTKQELIATAARE